MVKSLISLFLVLATAMGSVVDSSTNVGLTQICIWLPIILVLIVFSVVYSMVNMDNGRDSLLYAKFVIVDSERDRR
jgi:Renin receptor-like protein